MGEGKEREGGKKEGVKKEGGKKYRGKKEGAREGQREEGKRDGKKEWRFVKKYVSAHTLCTIIIIHSLNNIKYQDGKSIIVHM